MYQRWPHRRRLVYFDRFLIGRLSQAAMILPPESHESVAKAHGGVKFWVDSNTGGRL